MTYQPPPLALLAISLGTQRLVSPDRPTTTSPLAVAVASLSAALLVTPVARFRAAGTTVDPRAGAVTSTLVTTGANAFSRNPMYLGMAGLLFAHSLWRRSWVAAVPAVMFVGWIDRVQVPAEEQHLAERFGHSWTNYSGRVDRWLGLRLSREAY